MLVRLQADDLAELSRTQSGAKVDHVLRIAQDQADHRAVGAAVDGQQAREFEGFIDGHHDRLFGEHLHPSFQAKANVFEVEEVR